METQRLQLRDRSRELIAEMLKQSKVKQMEFFGFETEKELDAKIIRVKKGLAKENVDYRIFDFIEKSSQKVVGNCGFHNWVKEHARAEIGYGLHQAFRGKGYMREALEFILSYGFQELKLNRIEALIAPDNLKSIQVVEHWAFVREGVLRQHYKEEDGTFDDSVMYSLLKSDFKF